MNKKIDIKIAIGNELSFPSAQEVDRLAKLFEERIIKARKEAYDKGVEDRLGIEDTQRHTIEQLRAELNARYAKDIEETWYWLGDGNDHLENLTCPILIQPEDLINELEEARHKGSVATNQSISQMIMLECKFRKKGVYIPIETYNRIQKWSEKYG